jgi:hypothetical protein
MLAGPHAPIPDLKEGQRVTVLFSMQDPIEGVVASEVDRNGWVKIEQDYLRRKVTFLALAACCVPAPTDADHAEAAGLNPEGGSGERHTHQR